MSELHADPTPKRKRRWWVGILICILATAIALGVLLFANPSNAQYSFLKGSKLKYSDQSIFPAGTGLDYYSRNELYILKMPFPEAIEKAKSELLPRGFRVSDSSTAFVSYNNSSRDTEVAILKGQGQVEVVVREARNATFQDRARQWFKSLFQPKQKLNEEVGWTK